MDVNLDTLKREILEYLESGGYAVFHHAPGTLEGLPMVLWDVEGFPDYQGYLEVAQKTGTKLVMFGTREFEFGEVEELLETLEESPFSREEQRDYQSRLRELSIFQGVTCALEMAFAYDNHLYVYELQPDWYEEYLGMEDEIATRLSDEDDDDGLGGYFSKN